VEVWRPDTKGIKKEKIIQRKNDRKRLISVILIEEK
jgi:hypothetical protein